MANNRGKSENSSTASDHTCVECGLKFRTEEALEVHRGEYHPGKPTPPTPEDEALEYAPGATVADYETGPRPGGKMDRETSRPAKQWGSRGEGGEPRKGLRNEGVAPIEFPPDPLVEDTPPGGSKSGTSSKRKAKKSA